MSNKLQLEKFFSKMLLTENETINKAINSLSCKRKTAITYFDQRCFNIALNNENYLKILDENFIVYLDGTGMRIGAKFLFNINGEKFNGSDMNEKLFRFFIENKKRLFIIGGKLENDIQKFKNKGLNIVGYFHGFFSLEDIEKVILRINASKPEVIILGMGVPKQELVTNEILKQTNSYLYLCVGNFLEFYLGKVKRAPFFLRNSGFEWTYRLINEPIKLWKRYLIGIPVFIFSVIKYKLKMIF